LLEVIIVLRVELVAIMVFEVKEIAPPLPPRF
jgi:hypothetical protein